MTRINIAGIMAATGVLLMIACSTVEQAERELASEGNGSGRDVSDEVEVKEGVFGPDVTLKEDGTNWVIWARVNAADDLGISIQNIKANDEITVESIAGVAYFAGRSGWWGILSTIYAIGGAVFPASSLATGVITALDKQTAAANTGGDGNDEASSKPRDGYGRDMDGNYAQNEGGLAICLPAAPGPMYANEKNYLEDSAGTYGRFDNYIKPDSDMKGRCFFPTRMARMNNNISEEPNMRKTAAANGTLYIFAFDSNYRDNAGAYEVKLRINRPVGAVVE